MRAAESGEQVLRARARALARPIVPAVRFTDPIEILALARDGERYAIEAGHVLEVLPVRDLTPVPCTPAFVLGVVNRHGRMLAVLDVRRVVGLPSAAVTPASRIVVVEAAGLTFGIVADSVTGPIALDADSLSAPPASVAEDRRGCIRGMTPEMIAVLDLDTFARDPRIVVNDELD
jgi:purine-binding chemotaxis protein CheW